MGKVSVAIAHNQQGTIVGRWIKEACDTQELPEPGLIGSEFEEIVFWRKWRAPKLIYMRPAGNMPYDAANVWAREDEVRTCELLQARSHRFIEFLDLALQKMAGDAHVQIAQNRGHAEVLRRGLDKAILKT